MAIESPASYRFDRFELQPDGRRLLADGQPVALGPRAFDLLVVLAERSGQLVTKGELLARVWGRVVVEDNALQAHVSALRKALGPQAIATVSGQGYRFTLGVEAVQSIAPPAPPRKHNLPQPLTSFIGREREIAEVRCLLASMRLLTLTGAGGCGKTRLALQAAAAAIEDFPEGVWLVELAPLGDATLLAQAVAKALGLEAQPGEGILDALRAWIGTRRLLLVLDNAEHLLDACARLADGLLGRCAHLSILVTSRERLGLHGERVYRVPSLSVPDPLASVEVMASEAARLFIARARLQRPDFEVVTHQDEEVLASICRRLDGIALAIELAAPRMTVLSLKALSERLDDRFQVLTDRSPTTLPRHRTLRSLIDWSHELLSAAEQAVLRRASVFAGGWTLEAAERVCGGGGVAPGEVQRLLTSLADKSMVAVDIRGEEARFGMLETMRHYAREQLRNSGEETLAIERHISYLLDLVGGLEPTLTQDQFGRTLIRLEAEKDNLRAALARCENDPTRLSDGLRLAALLPHFWSMRGYWQEGRAWLRRLLAAAPVSGRGEVHAMALFALGQVELFGGNGRAGIAPLREAIDLCRRQGHRRTLLRALGTLGQIEEQNGDLLAARGLLQEALTLAREIQDLRNVSAALATLAQIAVRLDEPEVAQALMDECLPLSRAAGPLRTAGALNTLGWARHVGADLEGACAALSEAAAIEREAGFVALLGWTLTMLSEVFQDRQDIPAARALMREALDANPAGPQSWLESSGLASIAGLSVHLGDAMAAARLYGQVQGLREATGETSSNPRREKSLVAAARQALQDDEAFERACNEGRAWSYEEAVRHACALV